MRIFDHDSDNAVSNGDRWTPVLQGEIYCSPACGGRCKKADYDLATEQAALLAARLGHGWKPRIWENLGWHYIVEKGAASVIPAGAGGYSARIKFDLDERTEGDISQEHADPRFAMQMVVERLEAKISRLKYALASASLEPLEIEDL